MKVGPRINAMPSERFVSQDTVLCAVKTKHLASIDLFEPGSGFGVIEPDNERHRHPGLAHAFDKTEDQSDSPMPALFKPTDQLEETILLVEKCTRGKSASDRFAESRAK